jgi:hypothetical protein
MPPAKTRSTVIARPSGRAAGGPRKLCAISTLVIAAASATCAGCAGSGDKARKPTAIVSPSPEADAELRGLLAAFARGGAPERISMEAAITGFMKRRPKDPLVRWAEALLAWIALDRGQLDLALARARAAEEAAGTGTVGDIARTVEGAALRRQGKPAEALAKLSPLVSKLVDGWARALLNQEVVESALDAGQAEVALGLMSTWLREAGPEERATVRAHLAKSLARVPAYELGRWLTGKRAMELAQAAEEELEIRKLVAQQLAAVAIENKDADLAQLLLAIAGNLLGDRSEAIAQLATGASRARVEARTVGLLLSLRNDKTRRRGAEIADGVAFGLGLPGSPARLVSRDDHGAGKRIEEALAQLSADGASIVIAGADEDEANVAAAFAESRQIPVILLRRPSALPAGARFSFIVGVDPVEHESMLIGALHARAGGSLAILVDEPIRPRDPRPEISHVRGCSEAAAPWKPLGVSGVVLAAQPDCARAAIVAAAPERLRFAAGFEADAAALPPGSLVTTAGLFPIAPLGKHPALAAWMKEHATPPSWWVAMGHDAAVLAYAGVQALPQKGTEEPKEVAARRAWAAQALETAQAELWTTEAKGFGGARTLPRTVGVREVVR